MHLDHDALVLYYYGEMAPADRRRLREHLGACEACETQYRRLKEVLALADGAAVDEPGEGFERDVWARLQPHLAANRPWWRRRMPGLPVPRAAVGAVAATLVVAFLAGWLARGGVAEPDLAGSDAGAVRERVLLVAVGDHLERSQMVLVELMNAEGGLEIADAGARNHVADLVAANRLYRQTASLAGDETAAGLLDDLERVLIEIANAPPDVVAAELVSLRERVERQGILFRVRVLSSELRAREQAASDRLRSTS